MLRLARILVLVTAAATLSACASSGRGIPAPVETREAPSTVPSLPPSLPSSVPPTVSPAEMPSEVRRSELPSLPPVTEPEAPATPVSTLLAAVDAAIAAGQLEQAAALSERALRISPRDGQLWYRLASIRFQQQRYSDAVGFAQRALSFAGSDRALTQDSNQLLARANAAQ
jgi:hypothetical protein